MNWEKLFYLQSELDDHIEKEHPIKAGENRLSKKHLALLVEIGELANEWQMFKFWKKDPKPRTKVRDFDTWVKNGYEFDENGNPTYDYRNPLLEEYVDGLHFLLSIGNDINYKPNKVKGVISSSIIMHFHELFYLIADLHYCTSLVKVDDFTVKGKYLELLENYIGLGFMLGFTAEQIEEAYLEKNEINHLRQIEGY